MALPHNAGSDGPWTKNAMRRKRDASFLRGVTKITHAFRGRRGWLIRCGNTARIVIGSCLPAIFHSMVFPACPTVAILPGCVVSPLEPICLSRLGPFCQTHCGCFASCRWRRWTIIWQLSFGSSCSTHIRVLGLNATLRAGRRNGSLAIPTASTDLWFALQCGARRSYR